MNFKVFVKNLDERILHIAKQEADLHGFHLKKLGVVNRTSILSLNSNRQYLAALVETLETDRRIKVVAAKDNKDNFIEFRAPKKKKKIPFFTRHTLSIESNDFVATYS